MSVSKRDYAFGDLPGKIDSGCDVSQMFTGSEGSSLGPGVGWGEGAGECLEQ